LAARKGPGRRVGRWLAVGGLALAMIILTLGVATWVFLSGLTNPGEFVSLAEAVPGTRVNILVMGLDAPISLSGRAIPDFDIHGTVYSRTDTMFLVSVDTETADVGVLSLPRDTRVVISGREDFGYDKLGHAHAYSGNPDALVATVSDLLDVPIHYYVRINSQGLAAIVDRLGGVPLDVEEDMHYVDAYQDLVIDIQAGYQILDGEKAVGYVRYRGGLSDIDRIGRQQKFMNAFKDKLFTLGGITRVPGLIGEMANFVDTNMTASEMVSYAGLAAQVDMPSVKMGTVPGDIRTVEDPGRMPLSYYVVNTEELAAMVDELVWGVDPAANAAIEVEVKNGTDVPGLATRFAQELTRQGYNVVSISDTAGVQCEATEIIDRSTDDDKLRRLSQAVLRYLPGAELGHALATEDSAEFTVILGRDYAELVSSAHGSDDQGG